MTWGTNPGMVAPVTAAVPDPSDYATPRSGAASSARSSTWALEPGTAIDDIHVDRVFIGSCTNSRHRGPARRGAQVVARQARRTRPCARWSSPARRVVKAQAEAEGLDRIFKDAGFEWRRAGCSMCLGMNPDILAPGERCASTSNRNFEGRQGSGGRTHLVSPVMAAAAALAGHFVDIRDLVPA